MDDGPDPADNGPAKEALDEPKDESVGMEALFVKAGRDHGSPSRGEDVEEEEDDVDWWINFHNCKFAGSHSLGDFGVSH